MPPSHTNPPQPQKNRTKGQRYVLSARAQAVLTWILEDIIEKTLEDARRMAESAGKRRVELTEVEEALKRLCERYHARWNTEIASAKQRKSDDAPPTDGGNGGGSNNSNNTSLRRHLPKRF